MTELKVGQRWKYDTPSYRFIVEIISDCPIAFTVIQSFCSEYKVGYMIYSWKPYDVYGGGWQYLQEQDKPTA